MVTGEGMARDIGGGDTGQVWMAGPAERPVPLPRPDDPPSAGNGYYCQYARLLAESFRRCTGRELIAPVVAMAGGGGDTRADDIGHRLFDAPFAVLSHGEGADPCFTYGNRTALALFEADWVTLLTMPSRLSAEPVDQAERARLLARVREHGFIDDYKWRPHLPSRPPLSDPCCHCLDANHRGRQRLRTGGDLRQLAAPALSVAIAFAGGAYMNPPSGHTEGGDVLGAKHRRIASS